MSKHRKVETRTTTLEASEARVIDAPHGTGTVLVGYPVVFDAETTIREGGREFRESFARGSLKQTLAGEGRSAVVMFDHGTHSWVGSLPLGRPSVMRTDDHGLYVEVPLSDTSYNRDLAALIRDQAITGMSVRMQVIHDDWENTRGQLPVRRIKEIRLLEFGPVVMPAYRATSVGMRGDLSPERAAALARLRAFAQGGNLPAQSTPAHRGNCRPARRAKASLPRPPELSELLAAAAKAQMKQASPQAKPAKRKWRIGTPLPKGSAW